jgi:pyruvate formate lyase activating enzyme
VSYLFPIRSVDSVKINHTRQNPFAIFKKCSNSVSTPGDGCAMTRRTFMAGTAALISAAATGLPHEIIAAKDREREARYYERLEQGRVRCTLCPRGCVTGDRERGYCRVRENRNGTYYTLVYGYPCALHLDPIEKKPFFHVLPGTASLSLATVGCNLECKFCQNWQISQSRPEQVDVKYVTPASITEQAIELGAPTIAYTYGEPVVFIEYVQDIARTAKEKGVRSIVISNGYMEQKPLRDNCALISAMKIDLKAFDDAYYRSICGGTLKPVLDSIVTVRSEGVWLEIVYLMVPTLNDDPEKIREMARWLVRNAGDDVPVHFSRFFPQFRLKNLPPTPVSSLERAYEVCREEGLKYVYVGNVPQHWTESTYCPGCEKKIISRSGYRITAVDITGGTCRFCGEPIPGLWGED